MKPSSKLRRLAGILAVAALTAACTASSPAASSPAASPPAVLELACTTLPIASTSAAGASGQHARPDWLSVPGFLSDVAAQSSSSALAVGSSSPGARHSRALVALWNGAAWTTLSTRALPRRSGLGAVAEFPGGAWVVGEYGLREHGDGGGVARQLIVRVTGTTVRRVPVPGPVYGSLGDVAATSAANAWAVGYSAHGPLILHWNGAAWKRVPLPAAAGRGGFAGVAATSATNAWAILNPENGVVLPGIKARIVHWNGRRWGDVVTPAIGMSYRLYDVAATSAKNAWAVGSTGSARAVILHWNGLRWTCALSPKMHRDLPGRSLFAVSASSADNAWAVGSSAERALALHWNGHSWKQVMIPQPTTFLGGVAFIPPSGRAWAVGGTDRGTLMLQRNGTAWH